MNVIYIRVTSPYKAVARKMSSFSKAGESLRKASSSSLSSITKASGRSSESSKEFSKWNEAQWKGRRQSCDAFIVQVKEKLRNLPQYKDLAESALEATAVELTDPEQLRTFFSHLIEDPVYEAVSTSLSDKPSSEDPDNDEEAAKAAERDHIRVDGAKVLPVKLYLRYIKIYDKKPKLSHNFASLMGADHGPMHAALKVGDVLLEWNTSCLVVPRYEHDCKFVFEADIAHSESLRKIQGMASSIPDDKSKVVENLFEISAAKSELIDALIAVIVEYNRRRYYNVFSRNCQTFVDAAMKALGIKDGPKLEGKMLEYYNKLKAGKSEKVPNAFPEHIDLDRYVLTQIEKDRQLADMPSSDLQYLACVYHQFHLIQTAKSSPLSDEERTECMEPTCQLTKLVSVMDARCHNTLTEQHP